MKRIVNDNGGANMKILHLSLKSLVMDGWNYQDNLLTKFHRKMGYEVMDITSKWIYDKQGNLIIDERNEYVNNDGVIMLRLSMKGKESFERRFQHYEELYEKIAEFAPDIIFIHSVNFTDIPEVIRYLKKHKSVKVFVDNHADKNNSGRNWISYNILHKIIWRYYAKMLIPFTIKFFGVTPDRCKYLEETYHIPAEKIELLVMGADDELVATSTNKESILEIRKKYCISEDDFLVITGGKINSNRPETMQLIRAIQELKTPNVKLIIFGSISEELKEEFDSLIDGKRILYIGWMEPNDTYDFFAAADLVAFPGLHSVFWEQVVPLGVPLLCKDIEGVNHIDIGGNVRFINTSDKECIRSFVETIVTDKNMYNKMKTAAKSERRKEFLYSNIAKKAIGCEE